MRVAHCYNYKLLILIVPHLLSGADNCSRFTPVAGACGTFLFWSFSLLSGVDIYSRFTPGPVVGACGTLL